MDTHFLRRITLGTALALLPLPVAGQQAATVSGRVTSAAGVPLANASVVIDQLRLGTQTGDDGRYALTVPAARTTGQSVTITARLIGFKPTSQQIVLGGGGATADFSLGSNPLLLGEVVVTGSGTQTTREKLGATINSVSSQDIVKSNESNVVNALAAKAPNIEVNSQAGDPGAGSFILIRGLKTIQGTGQPLFIVDGSPIDNSTNATDPNVGVDAGTAYTNRAADLNPNDIESIDVLKGAAASALYGSRAAQGVILITTKSGRSGETKYSLQSTASWDQVNRRIPLQTTFGRGNFGVPRVCQPGSTCFFRSWGPPLAAGTPIYNHWDELFHTGTTFDNIFNVSGGDARRTFFLSAGSTNQNGVARGPNSYYDRRTVRLKAAQSLTDRLRVGGNISYASIDNALLQKGNNLNGLLLGATRQPPEFNNQPYITPEGWQRGFTLPIPTSPTQFQIFDNPLWVIYKHKNQSKVGRSFGNVNLDYDASDWFKLRYTLGADYSNDERMEAQPPFSAGNGQTGQIYQGAYTSFNIDHNLLATLTRHLGESVNAELNLGQNLNSNTYRQLQVLGTGFIDPTVFTLNNTVSTNLQPQNFESKVNIAGYFGQLGLDFSDQLYLKGGVRADQSSTFSAKHRTNYFPQVSAAWSVSNSLGNRDQRGTVSYLKVRSAYGEVGREPNPYQILTTFTSQNQIGIAYGGGTTNPSQAGNGGLISNFTRGDPNLGPERTAESEVGFDVGLFNQRVDGTFTYYNARTSDVILSVPTAVSTGYSTVDKNGARIVNKGVEVTLNTRLVDRPEGRWEVGVNWARNRNLLTQLAGADFVGIRGGFGVSTAVKGYPMGTFYGTDFVRCRYNVPDAQNIQNTSAGATDINAACRTAKAPNGALYVDANGFPLFDPANYPIGDPNPKWTGAVRSSITIKRVQLSGLLDVKHGGVNWNGTRGALQSYGTSIYTVNRATCISKTSCTGNSQVFGTNLIPGPVVGPGAGKAVPIGQNWWRNGLGNNFNGPTSEFVEDAGYVKLREISVAYTFNEPWVRNLVGMSSVDVRFAGRNLGLWTKYSGVDPETNLEGSFGIGRGQDYFNNPLTRSFVLSFSFNR
ncbi:MAG: SusC/RagA family TonB-linked outer membrane protein [Gemmatimonadaceae bacterium]